MSAKILVLDRLRKAWPAFPIRVDERVEPGTIRMVSPGWTDCEACKDSVSVGGDLCVRHLVTIVNVGTAK